MIIAHATNRRSGLLDHVFIQRFAAWRGSQFAGIVSDLAMSFDHLRCFRSAWAACRFRQRSGVPACSSRPRCQASEYVDRSWSQLPRVPASRPRNERPLVSSVWIDRHRRTTSRRNGPVVDPLPSDAVGSVDEFSTWRSPVLHDHHDPGVEMSLGMIDVG